MTDIKFTGNSGNVNGKGKKKDPYTVSLKNDSDFLEWYTQNVENQSPPCSIIEDIINGKRKGFSKKNKRKLSPDHPWYKPISKKRQKETEEKK